MENYTVEIIDASQELSKRDRIKLKDTAECISLDSYSKEVPDCELEVIGYVILAVHNENAKGDTDYEQLVIQTPEGNFITGSNSFRTSFLAIWKEMNGEKEPWFIRVVRRESKNYSGEFLKAAIV